MTSSSKCVTWLRPAQEDRNGARRSVTSPWRHRDGFISWSSSARNILSSASALPAGVEFQRTQCDSATEADNYCPTRMVLLTRPSSTADCLCAWCKVEHPSTLTNDQSVSLFPQKLNCRRCGHVMQWRPTGRQCRKYRPTTLYLYIYYFIVHEVQNKTTIEHKKQQKLSNK